MTSDSTPRPRLPCSFCGTDYEEGSNFCPRCGKKPKASRIVYSEFELGRIATLHDLKKDILTWVAGSVVFVGLLGWFGANQIIQNTVTSAVATALDQRMHTMQATIDAASTQAFISAAKTQLQLEAAQKVVDQLNAKREELSSSIADVEHTRRQLDSSILDLAAQKKILVASVSDLQVREAQLKKTIDDENLVTIFAKLRSDLYRIHILTAKVTVDYSGFVGNGIANRAFFPEMINLIAPSGSRAADVAEFSCGNVVPTYFVNETSGAVVRGSVRCQLFAPYERLLNRPLAELNGIRTIQVAFRQIGATPESNFDALLPLYKTVTVELDVNEVPLGVHIVSLEELQKQKANVIDRFGAKFIAVGVDMGPAYGDVKALYDSKIAQAN